MRLKWMIQRVVPYVHPEETRASRAEPKVPVKVVTRAQEKENVDQADEEKDQQPKPEETASVSVRTGRKLWKAKREKAKAKHEQKQATLVAELSQVQEELKQHREKNASIVEPNKSPRKASSGGSVLVDKVLEPLNVALEAYEARLKPKQTLEERQMRYPNPELQCKPSKYPSASDMVMRLAIELAGKPYDFSTSSNASRITKRLADGCSKGPRVFSALDYVKSQGGPFEHSSASRMFADGCSEDPRCVFSALDCVKLQCGPFEHPLASRITIRLALELVDKSYDLLASSNASRLTIRLIDGCSEGPRCVFSALNCVKLQRKLFEHPSASRITIRLALEFADKPYDLSASSNTSRLTIRLTNGCSKGPRCIFNALDYVKSQRGSSKHSSASRMVMWLALEFASSIFNALNYVKSQRGSSKHSSASRMVMWLALEFVSKSYDLSASSNASRVTNGLSMGARKVRIAFSVF
ncbi:hypothetical protein L7F22_025037 [Adiantum nelumboides]|nr:hypothetical protein [Adiantum nelumboides]